MNHTSLPETQKQIDKWFHRYGHASVHVDAKLRAKAQEEIEAIIRNQALDSILGLELMKDNHGKYCSIVEDPDRYGGAIHCDCPFQYENTLRSELRAKIQEEKK